MIRIVLTLLSFFISLPGHAESADFIDGTWFGKGVFQMGNSFVNCSDVMMKFSGNSQVFVVREASMTCDGLGPQKFTEVDTFSLAANGDLIFQNGVATVIKTGTKVGRVVGARLTMLNPIDEKKVDDIDIRLAGDTLVYVQIAGVPGAQPDYALVAFLKKKGKDNP
ncbi:hypothetical protein DFR50_1156 [Roseiarcus fermentans]|uniref:Uncharacterized protein n=1 Tax=Roseiarcus fermentans TaxID=1473586 RepID=A0A366FDR5_9HYPH|nr:hypothetical protein [Roseiarcus fermentans]RBP11899.1 hypothetical protein DFR50_1156 [Roseiarcus fermentans]